MSKSTQAGTSKAIADANAEAIDFDRVVAHALFADMSVGDKASKQAKADKDAASLEFCRFAASTYAVNSENDIPRDTITAGFVKHLDAMRPVLAAEGNVLVETVESKDGKGDTTFKWRGHGNNVKSIAKGVTEFIGHADYDLIDLAEAESFTAVKKSVEANRRMNESEEARLLREAKEFLREVTAELVSTVIKSDDAELIFEQAELVGEQLNSWNDALARQNEIEAAAESMEIEIPEMDSEAA
jgi:hypothetical protein